MRVRFIVSTSKLLVAAAIFIVAAASATAQDATSMASPSREPIWTARLLSIAINNGDVEEAVAMFADNATLTIRGEETDEVTQRSGRAIDEWLQRLIVADGGKANVQDDCVDGRTIVVDLLLVREEDETLRRFEYIQAENGLIAELTIGGAEGDLPCK